MLENINFHSTESSVVFSICSNLENPYWAEVHVHFGRYNIVHITIVVTSETVSPKQGTEFLENIMSRLEYELLNPYLGLLNRNIELEVYVTVFYYSIRISHPPIIWNNNQYQELVIGTKNKLDKMLKDTK